ncbi:cGAMP-activated phospholipase CapV [Pectobacterium carotovorum]|uniref:CBASS cGAMP-activated phospholipase n=1 Tax=Pectobacterium carotovorum TaxID=554 RepID=UPI001CF1D266|nr:CBASS cGAMP-activated phospholipase [Pectobacterium carotovorum]MCA6968411.1 cGAMP-activated phospholipase CapV [Pectobacterium carotovorum]
MLDSTDSSIRILSLNGGGARGLFTINVLAEIERIIASKTNEKEVKAGDYFDLITGTSIGGILALGLAAGKSARELEKVFFEAAPAIFPQRPSWFNLLKTIFSPIYNSAPLQEAVEKMIGNETTFDELTRRVLIPAVNLSTGKPQFFKTPHNPDFSRDGRLKLIDAAMATSAAPTYFAPHYCDDLKAYFADGGLIANNPSYIGLLEVFRDMKSDFPSATHQNVHILNIGTLGEEYTVSPKALGKKWWNGYFGLWGGGKRLVLSTMTANQILHRNMLLRDLRVNAVTDNYIYLDDIIPNEAANDITLDNSSQSSLRNLASRGKQLATDEFTNNKELQNFFRFPAPIFKAKNIPENI